jgi:hypothetical protein
MAVVLLAIYIASMIFVMSATLLQYGIGLSSSDQACRAATTLCLSCYVSVKVIVWVFIDISDTNLYIRW